MQPGITKSVEVGADGKLVEVRRFTDEKLQASITNALKNVEGHKGAILNLEANEAGFNAAIAANIDGHWSVALGYSRDDWGWCAGSTVKFAW